MLQKIDKFRSWELTEQYHKNKMLTDATDEC